MNASPACEGKVAGVRVLVLCKEVVTEVVSAEVGEEVMVARFAEATIL